MDGACLSYGDVLHELELFDMHAYLALRYFFQPVINKRYSSDDSHSALDPSFRGAVPTVVTTCYEFLDPPCAPT